MNLQNINTILDAPSCPKISPQVSPPCQIQNPNFQLQTPSDDLNQNAFSSFHSSEDQQHENSYKEQKEDLEMIDEKDQSLNLGKRSYQKFLRRKSKMTTILNALLQPYGRPRKRVNL